MQKGINLAEEFRGSAFSQDMPCIFISHKSEDKEDAEAVAEYIEHFGINVYLDKYDMELQMATSLGDTKGIVKNIQEGLEKSTHLLVLVTEQTEKSRWVPYEVGYAQRGKSDIASLLLRKDCWIDFPDFLKIETCLSTVREFQKYLFNVLKTCGPLQESYTFPEYYTRPDYEERALRAKLQEYVMP